MTESEQLARVSGMTQLEWSSLEAAVGAKHKEVLLRPLSSRLCLQFYFALAVYKLRIEEDVKSAFENALISAELDFPPAQALVGAFFSEGVGRPRDYIQVRLVLLLSYS